MIVDDEQNPVQVTPEFQSQMIQILLLIFFLPQLDNLWPHLGITAFNDLTFAAMSVASESSWQVTG